MSVPCPECGQPLIQPPEVVEGEILDCENCGAELDVVSVSPFEVMVFDEDEK